jgi:hypothetical protein
VLRCGEVGIIFVEGALKKFRREEGLLVSVVDTSDSNAADFNRISPN